jgi:hypothetical protein
LKGRKTPRDLTDPAFANFFSEKRINGIRVGEGTLPGRGAVFQRHGMRRIGFSGKHNTGRRDRRGRVNPKRNSMREEIQKGCIGIRGQTAQTAPEGQAERLSGGDGKASLPEALIVDGQIRT